MGKAKRRLSATKKLLTECPVCYFCGDRAATTREHMPPKSLFDNSHRPDKLIMPACSECNSDTSLADATASIVSRWNYNSGPQELADHKKLCDGIRQRAPHLIAEWTKVGCVEREDALQHLRNYGISVPRDAGIATIGQETIKQLNLFAHKLVLALYFQHFRKPLTVSGSLCAYWKSKEDYMRDGIPPSLLKMMPGYGTLIQGQWNERETFEYRHAVNSENGLFACLAKLRKGLFVAGFAATDPGVLPQEEMTEGGDWIRPAAPRRLLEYKRFSKKL
jgi:hypothetical protein